MLKGVESSRGYWIWKLFPSKKQWKNWSLPTKLTAIGGYVGIVSLIITLFTIFPTFLASSCANITQKVKLEPFNEETFGILVVVFNGDTPEDKEKGKRIQDTIAKTLNYRFKELNIPNAIAKKVPLSIVSGLVSHERARKIGEKYKAGLVIWGDVTIKGYIPNLTLLLKSSESSYLLKTGKPILKDDLCFSAINKKKDIRFASMTDEPTFLALFVAGLKFYQDENYEEAIKYFSESLSISSRFVDAAPSILYIGNINYHKGRYDEAIENYSQVIKCYPDIPSAYTNRGSAYEAKGDFDLAIADYTKAIELNSKIVDTGINRVYLCGKQFV